MRKLFYQIKALVNYTKWFLMPNKYLFQKNRLREFQIDKINKQIKNAFDSNKFYREYYLEHGLSSDFQIDTFDDFLKLPVLKKNLFKEAASKKSILSENFNLSELISHHTTGSTGNPTEIFTYSELDKIRGFVLQRVWFASGKISFKKILKVWRTKSQTLDEQNRIKLGLLKNYDILDYENMKLSGVDPVDNINSIYLYGPQIIRGYVSALFDLGKKIQFTRIKSLEVVIASAEYLSTIIWDKLEQMYRVPVINLYGGTEAPVIAQSSKITRNMHINEDLYYIELLDNKYKTAQPGQIGKIVITDLHNKAFPLIRYEIGDLAIVDSEFFNLDERVRYFLSVEGRSNDIFVLPDGTILYSHFWHIIFREENWIDSFQVIQLETKNIHINIKPALSFEDSDLENLKNLIKSKLPLVEVEYKIVQNIPLGPGGKELAIFSKVSSDFNNNN